MKLPNLDFEELGGPLWSLRRVGQANASAPSAGAAHLSRNASVRALAADMTAFEAADPMTRRTWVDFFFPEQHDTATRIKVVQAHIAWQQRIRRVVKAKTNR